MSIRLSLTIAGLAIASIIALSASRTHAPAPAVDTPTRASAADAPSAASATPMHMPEAERSPPLTTPPAAMPRREPADAIEAQAQIERHIATLDKRFLAESLDANWARKEERAIRTFFHPGSLAAEGLVAPDAIHTVCHSLTCRVSAQFADAADAELATQHLAMHLAERLPYGAVMPRRLDDGRIQVHAWYSSAHIEL